MWGYIACFLIGFILGIIVWEKISNPQTIVNQDNKFKKNSGGTADIALNTNINKPKRKFLGFLRKKNGQI